MKRVTRRTWLQTVAGAAASIGLSRVTLAGVPGSDRRLILLLLRGGLDGLAAVPATGDGAWKAARGELADPLPGASSAALPMDATFGLDPLLPKMHELYRSGELALLHAIGSHRCERSHFNAQNVLENGTPVPFGRGSGWLNLALAGCGGIPAVAVGTNVPLVLQGQAVVQSWSPSRLAAPEAALVARLAPLYADDPLLAPHFAAARALQLPAGMGGLSGDPDSLVLVEAAAEFLARADGPRVATLDVEGWDTHVRQQSEFSPLTRNFRLLDRTFATLRQRLAAVWEQTVIVAVTEFGRAVAMNGTGGTDHGTGGVAFLAGGAVHGGRVLADWPGLARHQLVEGRDLRATTDLRSLFKAVLIEQLRADEVLLEGTLFPDSAAARPIEGLFRK